MVITISYMLENEQPNDYYLTVKKMYRLYYYIILQEAIV